MRTPDSGYEVKKNLNFCGWWEKFYFKKVVTGSSFLTSSPESETISISQTFLNPMLTYIKDEMLADTFLDETGFCVGDFDGQSLSTDYGCSAFPVNDDDHFFTVGFGFTSEILTPLCPSYFPIGHNPSILHFCSIYADCDGGVNCWSFTQC